MKAELGLHEENKELTSKVSKERFDELKTEMNCLLLSNYSLAYLNRQSQIILAKQREKAASELSVKNSQINLLNIDKQVSPWKIQELEAKASQLSDTA